MADSVQEKIDRYAEKMDADIVICAGPINPGDDEYIIKECEKRQGENQLRRNIFLILMTHGGDPNAAYRIGRCFQEAYKAKQDSIETGSSVQPETKGGEFSVLLDGYCKSAGTLICLGANSLFMSDNAQLGPLDAQLAKQEEVGERTSGLTKIFHFRK